MFELVMPKGIYRDESTETYGRYVFLPLERGYGHTLGNALRRVLLSSVGGAAVVGFRTDGVLHEFSTLKGVLEEVPLIVLNLKRINFRFDDYMEESATCYIRAEGKGEVTAKDIELPSGVSVFNPDARICTVTDDKGSFHAQLILARGFGYVAAEEFPDAFRSEFPQSTIFVDGLFSPVERVNFRVENIRVGAAMDKERLIIELWTNGTKTPDECMTESSTVFRDVVSALFESADRPLSLSERRMAFEERQKIMSLISQPIESLELSKRTINCLRDADMHTVEDVVTRTEEEILKVKNFGQKSLDELRSILEKFGLAFGLSMEELHSEITEEF